MTDDATDRPIPADVPDRVEHTVLGPETDRAAVDAVLADATELEMRVCVPPWAVERAAAAAPDVPVTTVLDFPHGQGDPAAVVAAAERAVAAGATELDVVANVGRLLASGSAPAAADTPRDGSTAAADTPRNGSAAAERSPPELDEDARAVRDGLATVVDAVDVPVKVIVEAPLLDDATLDLADALAAAAGADYLKTATGFADGGATVPDVERLAGHLPVKASGGVGSWADARAMFAAGASRIGSSSGDRIVREWHEEREA